MPTITFGVGTPSPITVPCQRAGKAAKRRVGEVAPTANGNLRSFIRWEGNEIPLILIRVDQTTAAAIEALFANGAIVPCAGDVINNGGATVDFMGDYTDNMEPADTLRTPSLFLHEVGSALTGGLLTVPPIFLRPDAGTPGAGETTTPEKASVSPGSGFADMVDLRVLDAATPATCGTLPDPNVTCTVTYSATPEKTWNSEAFLRDGWLTGIPRVDILSKGGTGDRWAYQSSQFRIFLRRGGADVKTISTAYGTNGGFAGSGVTHNALSSILWEVFAGDRLRFELWGRLALHGGYADDQPAELARQTVTYGWGGAGEVAPVYIGGLFTVLTAA